MPSLGKIYKDRGNRWYIQLPGGSNGPIRIYSDRNHQSFYSKEHATYTLSQIQGEIQRGVFDADFYLKTRKSIHSFEYYADAWLKICEKKMQKGALARDYYGHLRRYVHALFIPFFGVKNISEIKGKDIREFHLSLGGSPKTVYNTMGALHKMFVDAVNDEVIQQAPKWPSDLKASQVPDPDWKWADEDVQNSIFAELEPDALYYIFFQAAHGTRNGESRALQYGDVDVKNDSVTIRRAFSGNDLRHTKTKRIRIIPLDPIWKELFLARPRSLDPNVFVFSPGEGKPYSRTWMWRRWTEACEKAGVRGITVYEGTRHSLASQAACRGVSIYAISKFLGHSNLQVTSRYAHLDMNPLRQVQRQASVINRFSANCMQTEKRRYK